MVPFSGMLHREQLADMTVVLHLLRSNADLTVASLRNTRTGKFQSLKEGKNNESTGKSKLDHPNGTKRVT
jgi:hypothetical protein